MRLVSNKYLFITYTLITAAILYSGANIQAKTPTQVAVASAHPLATKVGISILKKGGNAFDAAAAITATLAVVEPYGSGLGGGGFWLLYQAYDQRQVLIDGRERAPLRASPDMYLDKQGMPIKDRSLNGPLASGIPGIPAGIHHLIKHYGQLDRKQILEPAIKLARHGFPVTERYQKLAGFRLPIMQRYADTAAIFLANNMIPKKGDIIRQPDLADTLQQMIEVGIDDFYHGKIGAQLLAGVNSAGGIWQQQDLLNYRIKEREPIVFRYHDMQLVSAPPPSSGGIALAQILGILAHFDLRQLKKVDRQHIIIEAMRRAYRDRSLYLGDPDYVAIPVKQLLDQSYLYKLARSINTERASNDADLASLEQQYRQRGEDTTHFSVIDSQGNRVAATLSINLPFGAAYVAPGTGILLNNEMDDFAIKLHSPNVYGLIGGHMNRIEPGKRPLSSMTPTFVTHRDRVGVLGTPGGSRIISMVLLGILELADKKLPSAWVGAPRYHHQFFPNVVQFEQGGLSEDEQQALRAKGHKLLEIKRRYGNMQAIMWWKEGNLLFAASDPRGEGSVEIMIPGTVSHPNK